MAKVTIQASTPDSWSRRLEKRTVVYDPLHAEMIGYGDEDDEDMVPAEQSIDECQDESPENAQTEEEIPQTVEMDADSDEAGPSDAPSFSPAPDYAQSTQPAPYYAPPPPGAVVSDQPGPQSGLMSLASAFKAQLAQGNPKSIDAFKYIAFQARAKNPSAMAAISALVNTPRATPSNPFKAFSAASLPIRPSPAPKPLISSRSMTSTSSRAWIRGDVVMGGQVTGMVASLIKTVLSPVAWVTHGAGTVSKAVGNQLNTLARKL